MWRPHELFFLDCGRCQHASGTILPWPAPCSVQYIPPIQPLQTHHEHKPCRQLLHFPQSCLPWFLVNRAPCRPHSLFLKEAQLHLTDSQLLAVHTFAAPLHLGISAHISLAESLWVQQGAAGSRRLIQTLRSTSGVQHMCSCSLMVHPWGLCHGGLRQYISQRPPLLHTKQRVSKGHQMLTVHWEAASGCHGVAVRWRASSTNMAVLA